MGVVQVSKYIYLDTETFNAGSQYGKTPQEFVRLFQWAEGDGEVQTTTDYSQMLEVVESADYIVGHNVHYDLEALFGTDSIRPLELAQERKVLDTMVLATMLMPPPYEYRDRNGRWVREANHPRQAQRYFSLDNLSHVAGLKGKFGDLQELAKRHNPEGTLNRDLDYGLIPLDDPDFISYAIQDIEATRDLFYHLMRVQEIVLYPSEYMWRELELWAVLQQMSRNGIRPNIELAKLKSTEQQRIIRETMDWLEREFDFPTSGKAPWKSNAGKAAILKALASYGITPDHEDWDRTAKGAPSFSGDVMLAVTAGTDAEELGAALAQLQGLRSMPDLVLSSVKGDGRLHPSFNAFQKSGRISVYDPSILIFNKEHKDLFLADEGHLTVELDFSSADARAVAAMSGDEEYMVRFEEDAEGIALHDAHGLNGEVFFGYDVYHADCPSDRECGKDCRPPLRPAAKAAGLALNYSVGPFKLAGLLNKAAREEGLDIEFWCSEETYWSYRKSREAEGLEPWPEGEWLASIRKEGAVHTRDLIRNYNESFPLLKRWKDRVVVEGDDQGHVENAWGRRMNIDFAGAGWDAPEGRRSRSYTQSSALLGQSTTREMMVDALLRVSRHSEQFARSLKGVVHDAMVVDVPEGAVGETVEAIARLMQGTFDPGTLGGVPVEFPVGISPAGRDWKEGSH